MIKALTDDALYMTLPYESKEAIKEILNGTWSKKQKAWKFPRNTHVMRELMDYFSHLKRDATFMVTYERMQQAKIKFLQTKVEDVVIDDRLREYQNQDINYLKKLPSAGIFNQQRTGKSPTTIIMLKEIKALSVLLVCPASLLINWSKEFNTWDSREVFIYKGTKKQREKILHEYISCAGRSVLIISKDTLKNDLEILKPINFDAMVVDEAHYMRKMKSKQSVAVYEMGKRINRRYTLTGTPTTSHDSEIYGLLHFLYPKKFASYWNFVNRYFEVNDDYWGGKSLGEVKGHRKKELEELISLVSVQRKRSEVMGWLPEKTFQTISIEMSTKQEKLYKQMVESFVAVDEETGHIVDTPSVLAQLTRSRQLLLDPRLLGFDVKGEKTETILEELENTNEPIIIMSMFTSYLKLLGKEIKGKEIGFIHGEMSAHEKQSTVTKFQQGKIDVLLCHIISAGTGFTLDRGEQIWYTDLPFNYTDFEQSQDRIIPTTKDKIHKSHIITFECHNTVDERINDILKQKKSLTDVIRNGNAETLRRLL